MQQFIQLPGCFLLLFDMRTSMGVLSASDLCGNAIYAALGA